MKKLLFLLVICGCGGGNDCPALFSLWHEKSFVASVPGATPVSSLDLQGGAYGTTLNVFVGPCTYSAVITRTSMGPPELGTIGLSGASPANSICLANQVPNSYALSCGSLVIQNQYGTTTYGP